MTVVRVLGTLGKTVISIGLVILLFGIFQLWGTGVIEARAQRGLDSDFSDLLETAGALGGPAPNPVVEAPPEPTATPGADAAPEPTATPGAAETSDTAGTPAPTTAPEPTATQTPTPTAPPEPTTTPEPTPDPAWLEMLYPKWGSALARIHIPSLGVSKTVVEGVRVSDLRKGPGHYPNTPLPGQAGNVAIAGHRTTYGAPFGDIDKLAPGNQIFVETIQGRFVYQVVAQEDGQGHFIVQPRAVEVLSQDFRDHPNRLTLTACHPKGSARQRIIVVAELVGKPAPTYPRPGAEQPAPTMIADEIPDEAVGDEAADRETPARPAAETGTTSTPTPTPTAIADENQDKVGGGAAAGPGSPPESPPGGETERAGTSGPSTPASATPVSAPVTDSFGEGLNGDSDGLLPALMWGSAALAIWFSALFAGHRWRRLPAYTLSALPFLVVLFMAFWHIDRIIPSY